MRFGLNVSTTGDSADPMALAELARDAENAGWDGFFVWDAIHFPMDNPDKTALADPWIVLAAASVLTRRIMLGPIITPLARRRPWKVARETASLDRLSNGRIVLPVGLGTVDDSGFSKVGEQTDRKIRAQLLDESLEILDGLWSGEPFSYEGKHYRFDEMTFRPTPVQRPRIPIWVVAAWPSTPSMRRALKWDGAMPIKRGAGGGFDTMPTPYDFRDIAAYAVERRKDQTKLDLIMEGSTPGDDPDTGRAIIEPYADAGVTWWLEAVYDAPGGFQGMRDRIMQGPPMPREGLA